MQKLIIRLLFILAGMAFANVYGQNITFNHLTTDNGLSQFSVNSLYIDESGILWIGTREGLNRYNGEDIKTYKLQKNDPNSLSAIQYCVLWQPQRKHLSVCTDGVAEFNLITQNSQPYCKGASTASTTITAFSSVKRTKFTGTMKRPPTSISTISCPTAVWISFACTLTKVIYG